MFHGTKEETIEQAYLSVMHSPAQLIIKESNDAVAPSKESPVTVAGFILLGAFFTGIIIYMIEKRIKKKRKV